MSSSSLSNLRKSGIHDYVIDMYLQNERVAKVVREYLQRKKMLEAEAARKKQKIEPKTIKALEK